MWQPSIVWDDHTDHLTVLYDLHCVGATANVKAEFITKCWGAQTDQTGRHN